MYDLATLVPTKTLSCCALHPVVILVWTPALFGCNTCAPPVAVRTAILILSLAPSWCNTVLLLSLYGLQCLYRVFSPSCCDAVPCPAAIQTAMPTVLTENTWVESSINSYHMVQWCASHHTPLSALGVLGMRLRTDVHNCGYDFHMELLHNSSYPAALLSTLYTYLTAITWCSDVLFTRCDYHCIHSSRRLMVDNNSCSASHSAGIHTWESENQIPLNEYLDKFISLLSDKL